MEYLYFYVSVCDSNNRNVKNRHKKHNNVVIINVNIAKLSSTRQVQVSSIITVLAALGKNKAANFPL